MERSLAVDERPPPLTPTPSVPVSYRTTEAVSTEAVSTQVSTAVTTVVPPYQLILEQRLLDAETENRILRAAASRLSTSTQSVNQATTMEEIPIPIAYPADKITAFAQNLKKDSQLQSFASSSNQSTMYSVEVEVDSVPPPLVSVVQSAILSSADLDTRSSSRRIQPTSYIISCLRCYK